MLGCSGLASMLDRVKWPKDFAHLEAKDTEHGTEHSGQTKDNDGTGDTVADELPFPGGVVRHEVVRDWTAARLALRRENADWLHNRAIWGLYSRDKNTQPNIQLALCKLM